MKVWCCIFFGLVLRSLGISLGDAEIKLLNRLIKQLETKQESKDAVACSTKMDFHWFCASLNTSLEIVTWIDTNLDATLKGAVVDSTILDSVQTELSRLVTKYVDDNGGNVKECVYVAATMGITEHIIGEHIKPQMRAEIGGLMDSVIFKLPVLQMVHDKVEEKLPEIIRVITGPSRGAMEHIKQEIANKTNLDLSEVEKEFDDEHDHEHDGHGDDDDHDYGNTVDDVVYNFISQISDVISDLQEFFGTTDPTTVCIALPTATRDAIAKELSRFDTSKYEEALLNELMKIDIGSDAALVFPAIVAALMESDLVRGPEFLLTEIKANLDEVVNGVSGGSTLQALTSLISIVVEKHLNMFNAHEEMVILLNKLLADPSISPLLDAPLNTLTDVELTQITTTTMKELTSNLPASVCMEVKLLAGVAGVAQMDRFLMYRNGEIDQLKTLIVSTMDPLINPLGLTPEQKNTLIEGLKRNVDRVVAMLYISKMLPFVNDLEAITTVKIAMEVVPLVLMEMAYKLKDGSTREFVEEILERIARILWQKITCDSAEPVAIGAKIGQFVQGLLNTSDVQIEQILRRILLARTCVLNPNTNSKICLDSATGVDVTALVTTVKEHYGKALDLITRELRALKATTEVASPAVALEATRDFSAKHAACIIYEVVNETPCPSRPVLPVSP